MIIGPLQRVYHLGGGNDWGEERFVSEVARIMEYQRQWEMMKSDRLAVQASRA